jgi:hypothetical protein
VQVADETFLEVGFLLEGSVADGDLLVGIAKTDLNFDVRFKHRRFVTGVRNRDTMTANMQKPFEPGADPSRSCLELIREDSLVYSLGESMEFDGSTMYWFNVSASDPFEKAAQRVLHMLILGAQERLL